MIGSIVMWPQHKKSSPFASADVKSQAYVMDDVRAAVMATV